MNAKSTTKTKGLKDEERRGVAAAAAVMAKRCVGIITKGDNNINDN
jgi:hypothetical protein